jgi:hypothetical protein
MPVSDLVQLFCLALSASAFLFTDISACNSTAKYWNTGLSMNWTDAYSFCAARNGTLPVIRNSCVNDLVASVSPSNTWLAGTRLQPYSSNTNQFQWVLSSTSREPFFN